METIILNYDEIHELQTELCVWSEGYHQYWDMVHNKS